MHGSSAPQARERRSHLHDLPELRSGELAERAARPFPEPELAERGLHADGEASLRRERASRLPAALERAGVDRGNRKRSEPLGERFGLLLPPDGEMDAGLPAGEPLAGRVRQRVTDEQEDAHDARA